MELDSGTIAWMLTSTALVLLMTPGLALFYGGQARSKSVLNMMMMVFSTTATVGVLWVIFGYSMSFGDDVGGGLLGNPGQYFMLSSLLSETVQTDGLPDIAFVAFQAMFAILTVGLIAGAAADRMKFNSWMVFSILWATIVYFPIAHWVFDLDAGWIANGIGAVDFAGGTAVHINAGTAALVLCIVLGRRRGWPREAMRPHNLTMVMLGAGLLWFGWFGFNAGSAAVANYSAAVRLPEHRGRHLHRDLRLADHRADSRRQGHLARRCLGHRRRPRRHHPGLCGGHPARRHGHRLHRRRRLRLRRRPEVQAGLRRLVRRRGRPPRRWL